MARPAATSTHRLVAVPAASTAPSPVRRLPRPVSEPPYDDETGGPAATADPPATQGTLALSIVPRGAAAHAEPRPRLRLVTGDRPAVDLADPPRHPGQLPDPRWWTAKLAQAVLETLQGHRPVRQLTRWTSEAVYRTLAGDASDQPAKPAEPAEPADPAEPTSRPRVRSVHVCRVNATVVEACAVAQLAGRTVAMALRLEADDGRWLCTTFEVIDGRVPRRRTTPARRPPRTPPGRLGSGGTTPPRAS